VDTQRLLTSEQVAERLSVAPEVIRRWLRQGALRGFRLAGRWRIAPEDLERFLAQRANVPANVPEGRAERQA
jgi:excisionase family DNA binding protein